MNDRPGWCLDASCTPAEANIDRRDGGSAFCCGTTAEVMITERGEVRHENDGHFCVKSPRGIVMLEINEMDLHIIARLAMRSLVERNPGTGFNSSWYTGRGDWGGD